MKFSKGFERDYDFYLNNLDEFNFCGTLNPKFAAISGGQKTAKECLFYIESEGKNYPCAEPELLDKLLLTKAGINFQIKQWAEGMADGTLLLYELSIRLWNERTDLLSGEDKIKQDIKFDPETEKNNLVWKNGEPVYYADIESQYNMPEWVSLAVLNQAKKMIKDRYSKAA